MIDFGYRIYLQPICSRDIELLRSWRNDPSIYRWCRQSGLISDIEQKRWFESTDREPSINMFLCCNKTSNDVVGVTGLTSIDWLNRRAEFSLYIDPKRHAEGFGKRSLQTILSHGFINLGLNGIWGETLEDNKAQHMFESLGMKREGIRRQFYFKEGRFKDAILFSIMASEFKEVKWSPLIKAY